MVDRIIDLRKKAKSVEWEEGMPSLPDRVREESVSIEWQAHEYEPKQRSRAWFFFWGGVALFFVLFGIIAKSYFFIILVVLAFGVLVLYEKKSPSEVFFSVTSDGVGVGKTLYRFSDLKSFWIFEGEKELSLETKKTLSPFVRIPLRGVDDERIRGFLRNFIPEEEHKELVTDKIARNL